MGLLAPASVTKSSGGLFSSSSALKALLPYLNSSLNYKMFEKCHASREVIEGLLSFEKLEVEHVALPKCIKVGVCNWKPTNETEEDMFSNNDISPVRWFVGSFVG